jgi:hypothetical protein
MVTLKNGIFISERKVLIEKYKPRPMTQQERINAAIDLTLEMCHTSITLEGNLEYYWTKFDEEYDCGYKVFILEIDRIEEVVLVSESNIYDKVAFVFNSYDNKKIEDSIREALMCLKYITHDVSTFIVEISDDFL